MNMAGLGAGADRDGDGYNDAETVTDPKLLDLANAGYDWFCTHCEAGNRGDGDRCSSCGGPRYGEVEENHPRFPMLPESGTLDRQMEGRMLRMHREHAQEAMSIAVQSGPPPVPRRPRRRVREPVRASDGVDDYFAAKEAARKRNLTIGLVIGGIVVAASIIFAIWATRTHEAQGEVVAMSWAHETVLQHWTQTTTGGWEDSTSQRSETPPVNGSGERAGMQKILGSCYEKHHHDEQYVCGSHRECTPKTRTETYTCGETCRDNGNGFATCSPKTCTRQVPDGETCRTVDDYCDRPIYETWCEYETQEWRETRSSPASGQGITTRWPEVETGSLDRLRYRAEYKVVIDYRDRGEDATYIYEPGDVSTWLGKRVMTAAQAKAAEKAYRSWDVGDDAVIEVNNLGGVHEVRQGRIPAEVEAGGALSSSLDLPSNGVVEAGGL